MFQLVRSRLQLVRSRFPLVRGRLPLVRGRLPLVRGRFPFARGRSPLARSRGRHRAAGGRRPVAIGALGSMLAAYAVATTLWAPEVGAQEPRPGRLVPSVADFGWTHGEFSVSEDGAAQYDLPLWVPRGRGSVTPELSLSYSSRDGNGLAGVGWSLGGLQSITWCSRTIAQDGFVDGGHFDGTDPMCLGGNRLIPVSPAQLPQREYRTEQETFARITGFGTEDNVPDTFQVETKDGQILTFGEQSEDVNARLQAYRLEATSDLDEPGLERESDTRVTVAWKLNRIADRNGNVANIDYAASEGSAGDLWYAQSVPDRINYEPGRAVRFFYEQRPDPIDSYVGGVHLRVTSRLDRIEMYGRTPDGRSEKLREYRLEYLAEDEDSITGRSLLRSVVECDHDGTCKSPLTFDWTLGSHEFETIIDDFGSEVDPTQTSVVDVDGDGRGDLLAGGLRRNVGSGFDEPVFQVPSAAGSKPTDADADGRTDLVVDDFDSEQGPGRRWKLHTSNGSTFERLPGADLSEWYPRFQNPPQTVFAYLADLDGNALADFVEAPFIAGRPWQYRLNTGEAGEDRFGPRRPIGADPAAFGNYAVDLDGDGRAEVINESAAGGWRGWGLNAGGGVEFVQANLWGQTVRTHFGDVNGDGLDDSVLGYRLEEADPGELRVQLNSGNGFGSRLATGSPPGYVGPIFSGSGLTDLGIRVVDFNADGRKDVLIFHRGTDCEDDNDCGLQVYEWTVDGFVRAPVNVDIGEDGPARWTNTQVLDFDGDTMLDIVNVGTDENIRVHRRLGGVPDRLFGIGDPAYRGRIEVDYTTLANDDVHTPGTCGYPLSCLSSGGSVVSQHRVSSDFTTGSQFTWDRYDHTYEGARVDLHGQQWLGFAKHTVTRLATGALTVTEFENDRRDTATSTYPFAHVPRRTTVTVVDGDGPEARESRTTITNQLDVTRYDQLTYRVEPSQTVTLEEERGVGEIAWERVRRRAVDITYDDFGNPDVVTSSTESGRTLVENTDYRNDPNAWLIGLPTYRNSLGCTNTDECVLRETSFDYDGNGNHTVTIVEPNRPTLRSTTTTVYGEAGVVESVTVADNAGERRTDGFEYDDDLLHPTATVNAMGHRTVIETHSGLGVTLSVTDPNGIKETSGYDWFGRLRETHRTDGGFQLVDHVYAGSRQHVTTTDAGGGVSTVVVDQLGRERELRVRAFDGRTATTFTNYDPLGRGVRQVSLPTLPNQTAQFTTTTYDNRGRVTSVTAADGAQVTHAYRGRQTSTTDALDTVSTIRATMDGDVGTSTEDGLETKFGYGPFGETRSVEAPDGTVQTMDHDVLGRRISLVDPSSGTTTTTYNAFGEVATETDGAGVRRTYTHDALGRVTRVNSPDGREVYTWDTAGNGIGKLANSTSADNILMRYNYNPLGQHTRTSWRVEGVVYETVTGYDAVGRMASITYPEIPDATGRLSVNYTYNTHGYLTQVQDAAAGGQVFWTALGRDGAGQLTQQRHGGLATGVVTDNEYDPATGQLTSITATGPGQVGQLIGVEYGYDLNRNVTGRHDTVSKREEVYGYDSLNRLDDWHTETPEEGYLGIQASYAYDPAGNLTGETFQREGEAEQSYTYTYGQDGAPPHALTLRTGAGGADCPGCGVPYTYDDAGRQITGPQRTVAYNRHNLPTVMTWGQNGRTEYAYDADGNRVLNRDTLAGQPGQTVITVGGGLFERHIRANPDGSEIHNLHNIVVEGRVVAQVNRTQAATGGAITGTRTLFVHTDLQGSTILLTNVNGGKVENWGFGGDFYYDPFGRRVDARYQPHGRNRNPAPRQGFTGHEHEDHIGTINMKGRIYDPALRRFLTPDPMTPDPLASQGHNRYSYVRNNPTTLTDPTGLLPSRFGMLGGGAAGDIPTTNAFADHDRLIRCMGGGNCEAALADRASDAEFAKFALLAASRTADDDAARSGTSVMVVVFRSAGNGTQQSAVTTTTVTPLNTDARRQLLQQFAKEQLAQANKAQALLNILAKAVELQIAHVNAASALGIDARNMDVAGAVINDIQAVLIGDGLRTGDGRGEGPHFVGYLTAFNGTTGFKPAFQDEFFQVQHAAAGLVMGFRFGTHIHELLIGQELRDNQPQDAALYEATFPLGAWMASQSPGGAPGYLATGYLQITVPGGTPIDRLRSLPGLMQQAICDASCTTPVIP